MSKNCLRLFFGFVLEFVSVSFRIKGSWPLPLPQTLPRAGQSSGTAEFPTGSMGWIQGLRMHMHRDNPAPHTLTISMKVGVRPATGDNGRPFRQRIINGVATVSFPGSTPSLKKKYEEKMEELSCIRS